VHWLQSDCLQDQQIERPLNQICRLAQFV
jgi:hypothetical protein